MCGDPRTCVWPPALSPLPHSVPLGYHSSKSLDNVPGLGIGQESQSHRAVEHSVQGILTGWSDVSLKTVNSSPPG